MDDIVLTLNSLSFAQMGLAWLFVACYALALGGMLGPRSSLRAGLFAAVAAVVFSALSANWVHGALLMFFAIAGMGLFVATSWVLVHGITWWLNRSHQRQAPAAAAVSAVPSTATRRRLSALRTLWHSHEAP